jgi:hypothetical protein
MNHENVFILFTLGLFLRVSAKENDFLFYCYFLSIDESRNLMTLVFFVLHTPRLDGEKGQ